MEQWAPSIVDPYEVNFGWMFQDVYLKVGLTLSTMCKFVSYSQGAISHEDNISCYVQTLTSPS